jgi:predicted signal transduction protein with EAL and GGDEF domain
MLISGGFSQSLRAAARSCELSTTRRSSRIKYSSVRPLIDWLDYNGYASLASFVSFPFDKVKIDRSFTKDVLERSANRAVVASIMTLAHGLGVEVTAEGVETPEQLEYLRNEGVH